MRSPTTCEALDAATDALNDCVRGLAMSYAESGTLDAETTEDILVLIRTTERLDTRRPWRSPRVPESMEVLREHVRRLKEKT